MSLKSSYDSYNFNDYFKTDLPDHWLEKRLGLLAKEERAAFVDGPFGSDLKSSDYEDSGVPLIQLNNIRDSKHLMQSMKFVTEEKKQQLIRHIAIPGDVVIAKMADPVARAAVVAADFPEYVIVADCVKLTPNLDLVNLSYLVWAINCDYVRINAELVSTGTTRTRINLGELKKLKIPYPPNKEQRAIAKFLDYETAKIDTLIEKQQQLIKLLKEKRQAVISHAVTKGLNPNAPMRDSGVEWLGEVPAHWDVVPIKHIVSIPVTDGPHETPEFLDEGVPFISAEAVSSGQINFDKIRAHISEEDNKRYSLKYSPKKYDIYIVKSGATTGITAIVESDERFNIWSPLAVIRCKEDSYPYFVLNFMRSLNFKEAVELNWSFGTQQNIGMGIIENLHVTKPPIEEAKLIVKSLTEKCGVYDLVIQKALSQIELMQERRTALISAAVTGKIDVRNWQAPANNALNKTNEVFA